MTHGLIVAAVLFFTFVQAAYCCDNTFTLWQLPSQSRDQMNSYVLQTTGGKLVVIDGGNKADVDYLKNFLEERGNHVSMWFVSHTHYDHVDALTAILHDLDGLKIDGVYGSLLSEEWISKHGAPEETELDTLINFKKALSAAGKQFTELGLGQELEIDGIRIEVLGIKNPEIVENGINNSSVVLRLSDARKSVLFPGDLGVEGGQKLMKSQYKDRLPSDIVQMSHHGQHGVDKDFYQAVDPEYCLWPTPEWLWHNDIGQGEGSGPWVTQEVRSWMKDLGVKGHLRQFDGLQEISCYPPKKDPQQ